MSRVISVRDIQEMVRNGQGVSSIPADAILTPSARDLLRELETSGGAKAAVARGSFSSVGSDKLSPPARPLNSKSPKAELEAFFHSPYAHNLKEQICEMGRRLWQRAYVDGNGGNMAIRVGEDIAICTPTLVSKGSLKPEDMCLVDFEGNQILGAKKRTSEILMHLQIMKKQPKAMASCHCHPPYATGFAVAGIVPPTCMIPEFEVFVLRRHRAVSHAGHAGNGQARGRTGGQAQHDPHGQPRRRDLEPQQHRGSLLAHGNHRGLLPHAPGDRQLGKPTKHVHAQPASGPAQDQAKPRLC